MNAIVSLCHFCEIHGPSVLFCTQAFHSKEPAKDGDDEEGDAGAGAGTTPRDRNPSGSTLTDGQLRGPASPPTSPGPSATPRSPDYCEACRAFLPGQPGFISHDDETKVRYISSQHPDHQQVFSMVRQACVRSLSVEVCPGREGPIFFGDDHHGHVFSYTFKLKDSHGRGLTRFYSVIVVMKDKLFLINSWPFLVEHISAIIGQLQQKADAVYDLEHSKQPPRPFLHGPSRTRFVRGGTHKPARSLAELTNDKVIFAKLHQAFTRVLRQGVSRLKELLLEGPPTEDSIIDYEKQEETEEGFVKLFTKKVTVSDDEDEGEALTPDEANPSIPHFVSLRHLAEVLGPGAFHQLAYHTVIGNQIIVKAAQKKVTRSVMDCLQRLLPKGCCRVIYHSEQYKDSWRCNFLGLPPGVALPEHADLYACLRVTAPELSPADSIYQFPDDPFSGYVFKVTSGSLLPEKEPTVLAKFERALSDHDVTPSVMDHWLVSIREEWMNKVKVLFKFTKAGGQRSEADTRKLLQVIGAREEDKMVLKFWMTGLSVLFRNHMLSTAITQTMATAKLE